MLIKTDCCLTSHHITSQVELFSEELLLMRGGVIEHLRLVAALLRVSFYYIGNVSDSLVI